MPTNQEIHRVKLWYELASPLDRLYGLTAYRGYKKDVYLYTPDYTSLQNRCAILALLSPNNDYEGNLRSLKIVLEGWKDKTPIEKFKGLTTYQACVRRAYRLLDGEPIETIFSIRAKKTYNFYRNVWEPDNPKYVTIDGHMYNLWKGERNLLKSVAVKFKPKEYDEIAEGFREVAREKGILPNQLQGTIWWCYKRMLGIRFKYQMNLELVKGGLNTNGFMQEMSNARNE